MDKSLKSSFFIILLIFFLSFGLSLLAVLLAGVFSLKLAFLLFLATLFSSLISVTILGGLFTSLSSYLIHLRRLFRLDNLSHPLLLRLSKEAPGTYHHSILISQIASNAAKAIGRDALLCRVGAYFHDIGKLKNPSFFIENQIKPEELQNKLNTPSKSAKIIIDHVKEGINIAKEHHLPKEIINLIAQHHGTSLASYFYGQAKEKTPAQVRRTDFRYSGPKPQSKEGVILMLADTLEAKIRAKNGLFDLESLVSETIEEKVKERQLEDSNLSQREIFKLKQSFIQTLENMFHPRVEYPS